jgi:hypothetical protein
MEQMKVDEKAVIHVNYQDENLSAAVQQFQPVLYKDGNAVCALLGPDPQSGIFGRGVSVETALKDWDSNFNTEIDNPREGNETTRYILDNLNTF